MIKVRSSLVRSIVGSLVLGLAAAGRAGELYVGANYHPHDSNPETWTRDIRLMQEGGFRVVRMGHLAWDSFEPTDGNYTFAWFDQVMDMMNDAGIKVILDIAVRPAPIWRRPWTAGRPRTAPGRRGWTDWASSAPPRISS